MTLLKNMVFGNWRTTLAGSATTLALFIASQHGIQATTIHDLILQAVPLIIGLLAKDGHVVSSASH